MELNDRCADSKICFMHIYKDHRETFRMSNKKFRRGDKWTFIIIPILLTISLFILVKVPNSNIIDFITVSISIFVGLFLNLLVLLLTTIKASENISDVKGRKELISQTFKNVSFAILIGVFALIMVFLFNMSPFPDTLILPCCCLNANYLFKWIISFFIYLLTIEIFIHLLMILKRIYSLYDVDIKTS
ncbi:hypothetical protein LX69_01094 [Breznakibacter xylanolyticus]|uniref:Uncharacterized protein n=1 Tax=Breznakibacter xylanolyticus TaxID=990 RepID=A0A2W7ND29_9BACT|nr:hypothetical protein LX69_01094 [Breznakibacter xylanolyticus]